MRPVLPITTKKSRYLLSLSKSLSGKLKLHFRMTSTSLIKDKAFVNGEWVSSKDGATYQG